MRTCSRCGGTYDDEHAFCPEDGTPLEAAPISKKGLGGEGLVGELVAGRYRIEKFLGGGGFGVVYRVRDERLDDVEALKIVKSDMLSAKDARETLARFNREAKLLRRLGKQSRHIVGVTNLGEDERLGLFFTMDYVAGGDLKEALKEEGRPFQLPRVLKIGQQICDALSTAHGFLDVESGYPDGVVHRDLKLENVMLVKRGGAESVKILDFGIAKILGGKTVAMNSNTEGPGTPGYAPPEQILNPRDIDHRSDIFPLGVILYRLATGREPWFGRGLEEEKESGGMSWMAIVDRTLREDPIPPSQFDDTLPNEFQAFIMKCLEKDKEDRFGTAAEAKAALARIERQLAAPSAGTPTGIFSGAPPTVDPSPAATLSGEPATLDPPLSNLFGATPPTVDSPPPTVDGSGEGESAPELTPQAGPAMGGIQSPSTPRPVATRRRRARNRDGAPSWLKKAARPGLAVAGLLALSLLGVRLIPQANQFDWGTFLAAAELGQVTGVQFRGVELRGTSSDPDVGRFEVPVGERDLQDLGRELEALGVAVDPEGRPARVRLESGDEGDPRTLVIEGVDGCEPCSPGADVELAAGWHRVRWEDEGPDTGTIVLADLEGGFPDAPIRVGPALAAEA
ncbi:MAG: serine/threonine protein kinase, partial [Gemmatimonadetes bacterium]|nr:serine/threonine protein kinase [Gemmatimonadota bacterium]